MKAILTAKRVLLSWLLATATLLTATVQADTDATTLLGRQCAEDFHQGHHDKLWAQMTHGMQQAFGERAGLTGFQQKVQQDFGAEKTLLREKAELAQGFRIYIREAAFSLASTPLQLRCVFDASGSIAGFQIQPLKTAAPMAASAYLDYQTKAPLRLPFDGDWFTVWGGRTAEQNYHVIARDQRFAYDFLKLQADKSFHGDQRKKENYFCWDQKILAPADGLVMVAKDGLVDNEPGVMDASNAAGNHVVIDLGNQEFALLAHLRQGSVKVKIGDRVNAGQELGRCGNSGNTSEPHLHFHLQNAGTFGQGDGLPAFFNHYQADGKTVARGEPQRGQTISVAN